MSRPTTGCRHASAGVPPARGFPISGRTSRAPPKRRRSPSATSKWYEVARCTRSRSSGSSSRGDTAFLRYGSGIIRVIELDSGRPLRVFADPEPLPAIEGVDPRITPDGRFLIDVADAMSGTRAIVHIFDMASTNRRRLSLDLPQRDVDLMVEESGAWVALMDRSGELTVFDLQGRILSTVPPPAGARAVLGVDLAAREPANTPDPDEDWIDPKDDDDPDNRIPPVPEDGIPEPDGDEPKPDPKEEDETAGNPDDEGSVCVVPEQALDRARDAQRAAVKAAPTMGSEAGTVQGVLDAPAALSAQTAGLTNVGIEASKLAPSVH